MLASLFVKNFAIIDNIDIDFKSGLTVLTGETGAGKSLIIDAIGLLFGDRASSDLVRHGENKAIIEGVFINYSASIKELLRKYDIDEDDVLSIRREIYDSGKSIGKVNGLNVPISVLSEISVILGNIHNQFDTQKLVNPNNYFNYIDNENILLIVDEYKKYLKDYKNAIKEYNNFIEKENDINQKLDYYKFQYNELDKANLNVSEEIELQTSVKLLQNHEKIFSNVNEFILLYDNNVIDNIYSSMNYLEKLSQYDEKFKKDYESLNDAYYTLVDIVDNVKQYNNNDDYDENELDRMNERLSVYSSLKRKYKLSTEELINYKKELKNIIDNSENHDFTLKELLNKKNNLFNKLNEFGKNISNLRKEQALILENKLINNLSDLQLKDVDFSIVISNEDITSNNYLKGNGIDSIEFMVSFNKGEPKKSLSKTASGGELSRFMLALKAITCTNVANQTFVFDEIDTGVNGEVAQSIALKIKEISENSQVICVTHLPQVASIAENHCNIYKNVSLDQKTKTCYEYLDLEGRINNIALMISKGTITNASLELAKELLNKN